MKKQLVLLSVFLVGALSLWGMEVDSESKMKFMQALDKPEFKELLSLDLFKQFHQKAFDYFKTDQTEENRRDILTWIKNWLPLINIEYEEKELNTVKAFLTYPQLSDQILNNFADAEGFFVMIYMKYLESHPNELCDVLSTYFDLNVMNNKYYRSFLEITLVILLSFAEKNFSSPSVDGKPQTWQEIFAPIRGYVRYFETAREETTLFDKYKEITRFTCAQLQRGLQKAQQTQASVSELSVPIAAPFSVDEEPQKPAVTEEKTEEALGLPAVILPSENTTAVQNEQSTTLSKIAKQTTKTAEESGINEANSAPTFWENFVSGVNRFLKVLMLMGGV